MVILKKGTTIKCPSCKFPIGKIKTDIEPGMFPSAEDIEGSTKALDPGEQAKCDICQTFWAHSRIYTEEGWWPS